MTIKTQGQDLDGEEVTGKKKGVSWDWRRGFWQENDAGLTMWPEDGEWGPRVTEGQLGAGSLVLGITLREARKIPSPS